MRVTGIIACHNYADYVLGAMESFGRQDHIDKRLVVIDDGSSDDSWDVIRSYEADYPVEVFRLDQPQGAAFVRNFAIGQTWDQTDLFAFLDADDIYEAGKISRSVEALGDSYGHPGVAYSDYYVDDLINNLHYHKVLPAYSHDALIRGQVAEGNWVVSKEALQIAGRFDESFRVAEGFDLLLRVSRKFMLVQIPDPLVRVRVMSRSLGNSVSSHEWAHYRRMAMMKYGKTT